MEAIDIVKNQYIRGLVSRNTREDGRGMFDLRNAIVTPGVIDHAEGSAQVDLGGTRVLVGVKLQVDTPMPDTPKSGNLIVSAELLALAHADFEPGPPSPESIELARVVDRGIRAGSCVDLDGLFLEEEKVWSVFADIYVLNHDGNLFDASSLAVMSALVNARMPKYEDGKAIYEERNTPLKISNVVASTTFGKLERALILDPNLREENAADARLTIATDGTVIRAMQKGLGGSVSQDEVDTMVDVAFGKYGELKRIIEGSKR